MMNDIDDILAKNRLILFDGVCNLCNSSVDFVVKRDKKGIFKFASLQSEIGQKVLQKFDLPAQKYDSVLLIQNNQALQKSTAALEIARQINGAWFLLYIFMLVPPRVRNIVYDWIARNRYRWFGKKETCRLPTPEERGRFLG
ncbi:MAG: thiol-disulfide oxidoreductase DCC family protein [Microscillaceae bacterium]|jgi:predicted DCC family thiol-disulfide oxidoreductase YuxK|nr:thiol-disulfide oxidoreductase DCC family protein [Microscillaceae bacterium]